MACSNDANRNTQPSELISLPTSFGQKTPWHLFGKYGINIGPAWDISIGSEDVTIAIIDGQFLPNNPAFSQGQCLASTQYFNFIKEDKDSRYHGAAVASLINTCENNPLNLIGIIKKGQILWIERGLNPDTIPDLTQWALGDKNICGSATNIKCTEPNKKPAHVINFSFGTNNPNLDSYHRWLLLAVAEQSTQAGSIIVVGAGNNAENAEMHFPSAITGLITVGATTENGVAWADSNWGKDVEIMAPGANIPVASLSGKTKSSGTSASAPIVSSVIALMRSVYADLNWKTANYFLQSTAIKMDCESYCVSGRTLRAQKQCKMDCCIGNKQICTAGRLDAAKAVAKAKYAAVNGLPKVALVDADAYFVEVSGTSTPEGKIGNFRLFNRGGAAGTYKISSADNMVMFNNNKKNLEIVLQAKGQPGDNVSISISTTKVFDTASRIHIASYPSDSESSFNDEIIIFVKDRNKI